MLPHRCLILATLAIGCAGQVRISLGGDKSRSPVEQRILELTMADKRLSAMWTLWTMGEAAVPLLAAEVERQSAAAGPALSVLDRLGGEAAAAVPVLRRALATAPAASRDWLARVLARLDGPPCILACRHNDGEVVQLDFDGKVVRSVKCASPWGAWPLPDDRVGIVSFGTGSVEVMTWAGEAVTSTKVHDSLTSCRQLPDGDRLTTSWRRQGILARLAPDDTARWELEIEPIRVDLVWPEQMFAITRKEPRLLGIDDQGRQLSELKLPGLCHGLRMLPDRRALLAMPEGRVIEIDQAGLPVRELKVDGRPSDAFALRDGRTLVALEQGLVLLDAAGKELWKAEIGYVGPLFVRVPTFAR